MAIHYQMDRSESDCFNDPEWRKQQLKKITRKLAAVEQKPKKPGKRGRPSSGKVSVHMNLNPETVAAFRAHGPGWQALISDILDAAAPK